MELIMPQHSSLEVDGTRFDGSCASPEVVRFGADADPTGHTFSTSKEINEPSELLVSHVSRPNSFPSLDNSERDLLAKAKRLERFKNDINQSMPVNQSQNLHGIKVSRLVNGRQKLTGEHLGGGQFYPASRISPDQDEMNQLDQVDVIVGLCPDMCPVSERAERERKGDLDQYERLDGDRYQTTKFIAVKKYNRTAERDPTLIRPMLVLQNTMDYLLSLLDQSYDSKFIVTYNFLWDRMRAIRMDLRMQHLFNSEAIMMLEHMIRLHIIAMHEFCEFKIGEGFVEGFDAHLNIEQMNKASVELFQMYEDHRKHGINIPTEREFRGYYALLKLDKHPGYKVEPAELTLDLAQMSPEMRQAPEIIFARDVARACRAGNAVGFFRLARKASYLQICLMHPHFAKLRTQALASFYSGLRQNQGIPVSTVRKWLAMEDEDITILLEYHGFTIRDFEEQYMVKDGSFLHRDEDYPTRCSKLVQMKRSQKIVYDVVAPIQPTPFDGESNGVFSDREAIHEAATVCQHTTLHTAPQNDEEMSDADTLQSTKRSVSPLLNITSSAGDELKEEGNQHVAITSPKAASLVAHVHVHVEPTPACIAPSRKEQAISLGFLCSSPMIPSAPEDAISKDQILADNVDQEDLSLKHIQKYREEAARLKIKFIIRSWKRHASKKKTARERKQLAAYTALGYLSAGPPLKRKKYEQELHGFSEFRFDRMFAEKLKKYARSWSRLNVSEVVAGELSRKNPGVKYLCYKIVVCCTNSLTEKTDTEFDMQIGSEPSQWVLSKIMPKQRVPESGSESCDSGLVVTSPGMSIWRHQGIPDTASCCFSVITDRASSVAGANAVLFLISDSISWEAQKKKLHDILASLSPGANVPLLILTPSCGDPSIAKRLSLHEITGARVGSFRVLSLVENQPFSACYSDEQLREGLKWLATESLPQPRLRHANARELVSKHIQKLPNSLTPEYYISAFNRALDRSSEEVMSVARSNTQLWPFPEITSLKEFGHTCEGMNFPNPGWSSSTHVNDVLKRLNDCKMLGFDEDISWLAGGARTHDELVYHKLQLEGCVVEYLTRLFKMESTLACMEARIMLQTGAHVALLDGSTYNIIVNWARVFRRIFNWRLIGLAGLHVYILDECLGVEEEISSLSITGPSLDEMIEACRPNFWSNPCVFAQEVPLVCPNVGDMDVDFGVSCDVGDYGTQNGRGELGKGCTKLSAEIEQRLDELNKLLEKCRVLQDQNARVLAIYS